MFRYTPSEDLKVATYGLKDFSLARPFREMDVEGVHELGAQAIVSVGSIKAAKAKIMKEDEGAAR